MSLVVVVRGRLQAARLDAARRMHDEVIESTRAAARAAGVVSHELLARADDPYDVLAIDVLRGRARLDEFLLEPQFLAELALAFRDPSEVSVWTDPGWLGYREPCMNAGRNDNSP
jgi:hypothetical protein